MHQNTNILEEVPIYHKTRSAMHLFLHLHKVQRTSAGFFIGLILQNGGDPIPKCIAPKSPLGALHLEMRQKTDILEEVPIYHKTRSAMHLFLHLYKVQRTSAGFFIGLILQNGGDPILKCIAPKSPLGALHLGMNQNTNILEEIPIYHKTRSAMHLFLYLHESAV